MPAYFKTSLFLSLFCLMSCSRDRAMLVIVENVPASARSFSVLATHVTGTAVSAPVEPLQAFNLPSPERSRYSFLLRLQDSFSGELSVNVGAMASPNGDGCLLRAGSSSRSFMPSPFDDQMKVSLKDLGVADAQCSGSVRVFDFSPRFGGTAGGGTVDLVGWGFQPGADVFFGGAKSDSVTYESAASLHARLPASQSGLKVPIKVVNPDGKTATSGTPFQYAYDTIAFNANYFPSSVVVSDFVASYIGKTREGPVGVFVTDMNGNFTIINLEQQAAKVYSFGAGVRFTNIVMEDYNQDGALDASVALPAANQVSIRLFDPMTGILKASASSYATDTSPAAIASGDVDGDALTDLVTANQSSVSWLLNSRTNPGVLGAASSVNLSLMANPSFIVTLDVNGDSKYDIFVANKTNNRASLLINQNNPSQLFTAAGTIPQLLTAPVSDVNTYDLDRDGKLDLILAHETRDTVLINRNIGNLPFDAQSVTVPAPRKCKFADINNDGFADMIVLNASASRIAVFLQRYRTLPSDPFYLGSPDVLIDLAPSLPSGSPVQMDVVDLPPADGKIDILVIGAGAAGNGSTLAFLQNVSR